MTELDKEFIDKIGEMSSDDLEEGRKDAFEYLEEHGSVREKTVDNDGLLVFILEDDYHKVYAPRGYKFRCPIVPEGIDIKQFEVK